MSIERDPNRSVVLRRASMLVAAVWWAAGGAAWAQSSGESVSGEPVAFEAEELNPALHGDLGGAWAGDTGLSTPQAAVENFVLSARDGEWGTAARSLDFRLVPDVTPERAKRLAERFFFVLNQELWIDWSLLPDRPDGVVDASVMGSNGPMVGERRRSIQIGSIALGRREIPVRVNRLARPGGEPVWLFSAQTVENIGALYGQHGPSPLARLAPSWAKERGWWRVPYWQWGILGVMAVAIPLVGWLVARLTVFAVSSRLPPRGAELARSLSWPVALAVSLAAAVMLVEWALALPAEIGNPVKAFLKVALIASLGWLVARVVGFAIEYVAKDVIRNRMEEGSSDQRRILTQLTVARHLLVIVVVCVAIAVALLEFGVFKALGVAMLTSAGAAAVVLGIAGHAVLGNLIAGVQIALTQPFRVGDSCFIEGNWGRIENITYTYVIVNTWDKRRLVLPIQYFVQNHFENWSRNDRFLLKPMYFRLDFRADVDRVREKFEEIVRADEGYSDREDPVVQVTESDDETLQVRCLAGGDDPSTAWHMSCRVREKMFAWLREVEDGAWLPRERVVLANAGDAGRALASENGSAAGRDGGGEDGRWGGPRSNGRRARAGSTEGSGAADEGDGEGH